MTPLAKRARRAIMKAVKIIREELKLTENTEDLRLEVCLALRFALANLRGNGIVLDYVCNIPETNKHNHDVTAPIVIDVAFLTEEWYYLPVQIRLSNEETIKEGQEVLNLLEELEEMHQNSQKAVVNQ